MELIPGLTVVRGIPVDMAAGILTRQYTVHGGVIRVAAGHPNAGQIVRHLIPIQRTAMGIAPFSPLGTPIQIANTIGTYRLMGQVNDLNVVTTQVLQIASNTMILSGLHLTVTALGFGVI